jgi:teichuronic acid biosynthesis protein TuaE
MSVSAPPAPIAPRRALILAALAVASGAFAVYAPLVGLGLAVVCLVVVVLRFIPMPRLGRAAVMLTAVAAIAGPNLAIPQAPWLFAFRVLIALVGLGLLGYLLMDGRLIVPAALRRPAGILGLWVLWSALSIGWAEDAVSAARWTLFLSMMGGLAVAIGLIARDRRTFIRLLWVLGATFAVSTAIAMAELVLGIRLPTSALLGVNRDVAFGATSLFGNQNNFATYLTLSLPYLLVLPVVFRDVRLRAIGVAGAGVALVGLLYTGSKSNILATALIIVGLLIVLGADRQNRGRLVGAGIIAVLAVLLVVPSIQGNGVIPLPERAVTKFDFSLLSAQREAETGSGAVRSSLLEDGLRLVAETDGLGVGAGNAEVKVRALANFPGVANLHNWWLEVLVNGGVVGFALYLAFFTTLLRGQLRVARRTTDPLLRYLGLAGGLSLIGFIAGSLGPSTAIHFAPMWITFGLGIGTLVLARRTPSHPEAASA